MSAQRLNSFGPLPRDSQGPSGRQFIAPNFEPSLHQASLCARQVARQYLAVVDVELRLRALVDGVDMRQVMLIGVEKYIRIWIP